MRAVIAVLVSMVLWASPVSGTALSPADCAEIARVPAKFTAGWLHNSRDQVMSLFVPEAIFIPHDGVKPHLGKVAIEGFWFPPRRTAGKVTRFVKTVEGVSGEADHAILWGKSDLRWQDKTTAYHWLGYYLMAVERRGGKWLITYLMSSDEQPEKSPVQ